MGKCESFVRIECGGKTKEGLLCKRWLGDMETSHAGSVARFRCRDCKTLHVVSVVSRGVIRRAKAPIHAAIEYDPSSAVVSDGY